jgi:hypothetical protein
MKVTIERMPGEAVRIGPHLVQVLAVQPGRVVLALLDPEHDCVVCGRPLVDGRCPDCPPAAVTVPRPGEPCRN